MTPRRFLRPAAAALALAALLALTRDAPGQPPPASPPPPPVLGYSGHLRALFLSAGDAAAWMLQRIFPFVWVVRTAGLTDGYDLGAASPERAPLSVLPVIPFGTQRRGMLYGYRLGRWPQETKLGSAQHYAPPEGFLEVTPLNVHLRVSTHFRLGEFLTHDQEEVWPKYLVLRAPLLDKLELVGDALLAAGRSDSMRVMSGFRTPAYNAKEVGPGGRAPDSRHMYGDAADIFVDADGDSVMDDLDGDGRVTVDDARELAALVERVEAAHPDLAGGVSAYPATDEHGPFVHIDVRGRPARW
ncbi:MAG: D-Ala-D-Ala carboxypeptidase family metallohydrolase [Candidatus Eisenbacteria bacterium]